MRLLLFIFLFFSGFTVYSQSIVTTHLSKILRVSDLEFYDIIEDSRGIIWLAADTGLYRYDGKECKKVNIPKQKGLSFFSFKKDKYDRIWFNNLLGQFFYIDQDNIHYATDLTIDKVKRFLPYYDIIDENIVVETLTGQYYININNFKIVKKHDTSKSTNILGIVNSKHGIFTISDNIFLEKREKKKIYNRQPKRFYRLFKANNDIFLTSNIQKTSKSSETKTTLYKYAGKTFKKITLPKALEEKSIHDINFLKQQFWFSTSNGLFQCILKEENIHLKNSFFNNTAISKTIKDTNNNIWVTTLDNGFFVIPNFDLKEYSFKYEEKLSAFETIENHLFFGFSNGIINIINLQNKEKTKLKLLNQEILNINYDEKNKIVFINQFSKIYLWTLTDNKLYSYNKSISGKHVSNNQNGKIISSGITLQEIDYSEFILKTIKPNYKIATIKQPAELKNPLLKLDYKIIRNTRGKSHLQKKDGDLYVAFNDGLFLIRNKQKTKIQYNSKDIEGISLTNYKNSKTAISTLKNGFFIIDNDSIISHYNQQKGLLSNYLIKIKNDKEGLWILSEKGLQFLKNGQEKFTTILTSDEIDVLKFNDLKVSENKIYITGSEKVIEIPKSIKGNSNSTSNVFIETINIKGREVPVKEKYILDYKDNSIAINFNTPGFLSSSKKNYLYRLDNLEKNWQKTKVGYVKYSSLPYGNYTFKVKSVNENGQTSTIKSFDIEIEKPFWKTIWFMFLIFLTGLSYAFYAFIKYKNKKDEVIERETLARKLTSLKLESLRSQMKPHFIFNTLNSIQEYILINDTTAASNYLLKFSELIRLYLNHSKVEEISIKEEIRALSTYLSLEKFRFENFKFYINLDKKVNTDTTFLPSMLLQPYVENAIKHGLFHKDGYKKLSIDFTIKNNVLICTVEDNGIGREMSTNINKSKKEYHKPHSSTANEKRLILLNKNRQEKIKLEIIDKHEDTTASGTKVILTIPQKNNI